MYDSLDSLQSALETLGWPQTVAKDLARSGHTLTYEKDATVFHAGEPADLLYVVIGGEVKLYYADEHGERLLVAICRRGEVLGSMDLDVTAHLDHDTPQLFTAEALSRCRVAIITKARTLAAINDLSAPEILTLVQRANRGWARFCKRFLAFLMMDVRSRLAYAISEMADTFGIADPRGKLIPLRLSHEDFGELVGASRPMVSKHLKELAKAGIFYKQNGRYILSQADLSVTQRRSDALTLPQRRAAEARDRAVRKDPRPRPAVREQIRAVAV